jgi:soluble lytic murein transglycosylase-like protein
MYFEITDVWFRSAPPPGWGTTLRRWGGLLSLAAAVLPVMPARGTEAQVPAPAAAPAPLPLGDPWEAIVVEPAEPGGPGPWQAAVTEPDGHPVAVAASRSTRTSDLVPASRRYLRPVLVRYAQENGLPADLVMALAWKESSWRPGVVSGAGAVGVMQLMPATVEFTSKKLLGLDRRLDPRVPVANIRMGTRFLRHLVDRNGADVRRALIAYNQGQTSLHSRGSNRSSERFAAQVLALRARFADGGR